MCEAVRESEGEEACAEREGWKGWEEIGGLAPEVVRATYLRGRGRAGRKDRNGR